MSLNSNRVPDILKYPVPISKIGYPRWRYFYLMVYLTVWAEFIGFMYIDDTCIMIYSLYWIFVIFQCVLFGCAFFVIVRIIWFPEEKELKKKTRIERKRSLHGG